MAALRGRAVTERPGCAECHTKAEFTLQASLPGTLPLNSAINGYATEGALNFLCPCVGHPKGLEARQWKQHMRRIHARKHEVRLPQVKKELRLDSNDFGFICAAVNNRELFAANLPSLSTNGKESVS